MGEWNDSRVSVQNQIQEVLQNIRGRCNPSTPTSYEETLLPTTATSFIQEEIELHSREDRGTLGTSCWQSWSFSYNI